MSQIIPSKYRKHNFDGVAAYWGQALTTFPKAIVIKPTSHAIDTMVRRLREARIAKQTYGWKHDSIDESLWSQHCDDIYITPCTDGTIRMGPESATETVLVANVSTAQGNEVHVRFKDPTEIDAFCFLASQRAFEPKPVFIVHGLTPEQAAQLETRFDIGFVLRDDQAWDLIY